MYKVKKFKNKKGKSLMMRTVASEGRKGKKKVDKKKKYLKEIFKMQ